MKKALKELIENAEAIDAIHLSYPPSLNWEIPSKYGVPRFWSNTPISIEYDGFTSSLIVCERREEEPKTPEEDWHRDEWRDEWDERREE